MNLKDITSELFLVMESLEKASVRLQALEIQYQQRYRQLLLQSLRSDQARREAEVVEIIKTEGLLEPYYEAKLDWKVLANKKEVLIEISKNLRIIEAK